MNTLCRRISLDGEWTLEGLDPHEGLSNNAYKPDYQPEDPVRVQVPQTVHAALLDAGRIKDPYWEMNNEEILWIEQKEWWYFRDLDDPGRFQGPELPARLRGHHLPRRSVP